ncbi:6-phosphogluconolactonase [Christensenellaceae bacterium OttesenSCG-928-L17]|nr:6-phosphogluconolactonase [Christensenellaceae bacterium OttesenSCG-928-L17]
MGIMVYRDRQAAGAAAATMIAAQLIEKPNAALALMASHTFQHIYRQLGAMTNAGILDWTEANVFLTSEIMNDGATGLFASYLSHYLYNEIAIPQKNLHAPRHNGYDLDAGCTDYEAEIEAAGWLDFLILPVLRTGHIAYNIAGTAMPALTHVQALPADVLEECKQAYMLETEDTLQIVTMGMGTLMNAKRIVVCAFGAEVAKVAEGILSSNVSATEPLSMLQLHPNVTYILDEAAAVNL